MKWSLFILSWLIFQGNPEKEPVPKPSSNPFEQGQYHAYKRELPKAYTSFHKAYLQYENLVLEDSMAIAQLSKARMKTLLQDFESAQFLVDSAEIVMSRLVDTLPWLKSYHAFVISGVALAKWDINAADSLGERALNIIEKELGACNLTIVNMLNDHGVVQYYTEKVVKADSLVERSLKCAYDLYGENDMRLVPSLNLSATLKDELGRSTEAILLYTKALEVFEYNGRDSSYDYARVLNNKAGAIHEQGGALKAIELYEASLKLTEQFEDFSHNRAYVYYNMANMLNSIGYRNKALQYLESSIHLVAKENVPKMPFAHYPFLLKASIHSILNDSIAAADAMEKAEYYLELQYGQDPEIRIEFNRRKASSMIQLGRTTEALDIITSTLPLFDLPSADIYANERAEIYFLAGEAASQNEDDSLAIQYYKKSIEDFLGGSQRQNISAAFSYAKITTIHLENEKLPQARANIIKGLKLALKDSTHFSLDFVPENTDYYYLQHFNYIINAKIKVLMKLAEDSGIDSYLESALAETYHLEEIIRKGRSNYLEGVDDVERTNEYYKFYETILSCRIEVYKLYERKDLLDLCIRTCETTKDLMYKTHINTSLANYSELADSIVSREEKLLSDIKRIEEEIREKQLVKDTSYQDLSVALNKRLLEFDQFKKKLEKDVPNYYLQKYGDRISDLAFIKEYVKKYEASIIQYFLGEEHAYAFLINGNITTYFDLGDPNVIEDQVETLIQKIRSLESDLKLNECFQMVLEPLLKNIHTDNLIIIPDGKLCFLPFEALIDNNEEYLVENYNIRYAHSLASINTSNKEITNPSILSVAPGFSIEVKDWLTENFSSKDHGDFIYQPNALRLAEYCAQKTNGIALTSTEATERRLKSTSQSFNILLFATHGEVEEAYPLYSRIALLPDTGKQEDGILHAYEILNLDHSLDLTILTACQTGLGKLDKGQGASSISQAFRYMGCNNVIMSLWSIDEEQSTHMVSDFVDKMLKGGALSNRLTEVKRAYLNSTSGPLRHPFYWAGLVMVGEGEVSTNGIPYFMIIGITLLLSLLAFFRLRR